MWRLNGLGRSLTWYISSAGRSWNLSRECSFELFTAWLQAHLLVLTVNVFFRGGGSPTSVMTAFFFLLLLFSCLCSVAKKQHKPLAGRASSKVGANTYWQCSFFIKYLLSVMNVFISGPALTSSKNLLSVWDWGGGRIPPFFFLFCFCFEDFKLRIKNETQNSH